MPSMTGYGESKFTVNNLSIYFQIRSLNHKFLEMAFTGSKDLLWFENRALQLISSRFTRGKISVLAGVEGKLPVSTSLNISVIQEYEKTLATYYGKKKIHLPLEVLSALPGAFSVDTTSLQSLSNRIEFNFLRALLKMEKSRNQEGKKIISFLRKRIRNLMRLNRRALAIENQWFSKKSQEIKKRFLEFSLEDDKPSIPKASVKLIKRFWNENREDMLLTLRTDVNEEIERIGLHTEKLWELLDSNDPQGRQIDIYLQELQRETNTLCMKSPETRINQIGILMKLEVERLREQARNLE